MVEQAQGRLTAHGEDAELLRAGILLSYGMHQEAGQVFARLADQGLSAATRDRAWYYLAKIRCQRGLFTEADDALGRIGNDLPETLKLDAGLLRAQLLMAARNYSAAAQVLSGLNRLSADSLFVDYNLGVARIRSGDVAGGRSTLNTMGHAIATTEESRALRDQANLALGLHALVIETPQDALTYLERVRINGPHANRALLGSGWAAAALKQPQLALAPLQELIQRDVNDTTVLEAHLALGSAYAELQAWGKSAQTYENAIAAYTEQRKVLSQTIAELRSGTLVEAVLDSKAGVEMGWFWQPGDPPALAYRYALAGVLARHEFQEAMKNYRDLRYLANNLDHWSEKLGVFDDMLTTRQQAFAARLQATRERQAQVAIAPLRSRLSVLGEISRQAADSGDGLALASSAERALMERIARARKTLENASDSPEPNTLRDRLRLASGTMTWNLAQSASSRLWSARKEIDALATELERAERSDHALSLAQTDEPRRLQALALRVTALEPRLKELVPEVAATSRLQRAAIEQIAVNALVREQERLDIYTSQARFALAQLYDRGTQNEYSATSSGHGGDRAVRP